MQSDYKVRLYTWVKAHFVCSFPSHHLGYDPQIYYQICAQCRCHVILIVFGGYTLFCYGVAPASRIDKIISLFCKRALQKRHYSAKETNKFIDHTDRSHPINMKPVKPVKPATRYVLDFALNFLLVYMHVFFILFSERLSGL